MENNISGRDLKLVAVVEMMKVAYATVLRSILSDAVKKTDNPYDDHIITVLDALFGYKSL